LRTLDDSSGEPHLLDLPDSIVYTIAKLMGKRSRILCTTLRDLHGPPGATLNLSARKPTRRLLPPAPHEDPAIGAAPISSPAEDAPAVPYQAFIQAWQHPVKRLVLSREDGCLDCAGCDAITGHLPGLLQLECGRFYLAAASQFDAHAALTCLTIRCPDATWGLHRVPYFAPHLRALNVTCTKGKAAVFVSRLLWDNLKRLSSLSSLDLPIQIEAGGQLPDTYNLTSLTHLGLQLLQAAVPEPVPDDEVHRFLQDLVEMPLLSSIKLHGFRLLGGSLGLALQALPLTKLDLKQDAPAGAAGALSSLAHGCFPDFSGMPLLEHLTLAGAPVIGSAELGSICSKGSTSLRALELLDIDHSQLQQARGLLDSFSALTKLGVKFTGAGCVGSGALKHNKELRHALAQHTQLQHLEVCASLALVVPCLASFSELTRLDVVLRGTAVGKGDLRVVQRLATLRKLVLGEYIERGCRGLCMEAVRQLPLLEEVELWCSEWGEREVQLLTPPPERLKRVRLGMTAPSWYVETQAMLDVVQQLEMYGVDVTVG
jgi:hypothetical protein